MTNRNTIVSTLGVMLEQAARSSVAKGAFYDPGEHIDRDSKQAWQGVAESLVSMVEVMVRKRQEVDTTDDPQP